MPRAAHLRRVRQGEVGARDLHARRHESIRDLGPEPNAPVEVRGNFRFDPDVRSGIRFGEHLPAIARLADRFTVLRSMAHDSLDHGSIPIPGDDRRLPSKEIGQSPSRRTITQRAERSSSVSVPASYTAVHVNGPVLAPRLAAPGQFGGFLGRGCEPLIVGDLTQEQNALSDLDPRADLPAVRRDSRQKLLASLDNATTSMANDRAKSDRHFLTRRAFDLLASERLRSVRPRSRTREDTRTLRPAPVGVVVPHGPAAHRGRRAVGHRLLQSQHSRPGRFPGVRHAFGWDTHNDIFEAMKDRLLPRFDASFSLFAGGHGTRGLLRKHARGLRRRREFGRGAARGD